MRAHRGVPLLVVVMVALAPLPAADAAERGPDTRPAARELLHALKEAANGTEQLYAAQALIASDDHGASVREDLALLLGDPDRRLRCNAAWVLAKLGDDRGFEAVLHEVKEDDGLPRLIRNDAAMARGDGKPDLSRQVHSDRYFAAWVLADLKDRRAVPVLLTLINAPTLEQPVSRALAHIGDREAVEPLKRKLVNAPRYRIWPAYALTKLGEPVGVDTLLDVLAKDDDVMFRALAAEVLGEFAGDPRVVPALGKALTDDQAVHVRRRAISGLTATGNPDAAIPRLRAALKDKTPVTDGHPQTIADEAKQAIDRLTSMKTSPPAR